MLRQTLSFLLVTTLLGTTVAGCHGTRPEPARIKRPSAAAPVKKDRDDDDLRPFDKLVAGATVHRGLFELHRKGDKLYLVVPKELLGKEFLLHARIARGIGVAPLLTGMTLKTAPVHLAVHGERVYLMQKQVRMTARGELQAAVDRAYGDSVLDSAKIESRRRDGAVVVDVQKWFVSDLAELAQTVKSAARGGSGDKPSFSENRSFLESVKALPENVNVRATLTYASSTGTPFYTTADDRFVPVTVLYQFLKLPEQPMEPRPADDRVGFFVTARRDFSSDDPELFVRYINRWRLESAGPAPGGPGSPRTDDSPGAVGLQIPKRPIVYYVDPATPSEIRPYLIEAVAAWQPAFTAAGWKDAIRAEVLPPGVDPEDLRYPLIHWDASDQAPTGIGMPITDPRTGEILSASITLNVADLLRGVRQGRRMFFGDRPGAAPSAGATAQATAMARGAAFFEQGVPGTRELWHSGLDAPEMGMELVAQQSLLRTSMISAGALLPSDPMPQRVLAQFIKMVTMHEVGHTLGLRHNFKASTETPVEKLSDMAWVREHGLTGSVMEYPALNLPRGAAPPDFLYYSDRIGRGDLWTIRFGYHPDERFARSQARLAAAPGHSYATDEDGAAALDPTVRVWDLGGDPLEWARERTGIVRALFGELPRRMLTDNAPYYEMSETLEDLVEQYLSAAALLPGYIGGRYIARDHVGDPNGRLPLQPVPRKKQQEALQLITELLFDERALALPPEVVTRLSGSRWRHWGTSARIEPDSPVLDLVTGARRGALLALLRDARIDNLYEAERRFGKEATLTLPELLQALDQALLIELRSGPLRPVSAERRELQRVYVEALSRFALRPGGDLRALARLHLTELKQKLDGKAKELAAAEPYTRAHASELQAHIGKVLGAQLIE